MLPLELEEPLLERRTIARSAGASYQPMQKLYLFSGLALFVLGLACTIPKALAIKPYDDWCYMLYALLQTCSLLLLTAADLEINRSLRSRSGKIAAFLFFMSSSFIVLASSFSPPATHFLRLLPAGVLIYALIRFCPIMDMKDEFLQFTEVFMLTLTLGLLSSGLIDIFIGIEQGGARRFAELFVSSLHFLGLAMIWKAYSKWFPPGNSNSSRTMKLHISLVVYLFVIGCKDFLGKIVEASVLHHSPSAFEWAFGPVRWLLIRFGLDSNLQVLFPDTYCPNTALSQPASAHLQHPWSKISL